ncbi:MAG: AI-2E family transporter [Actinobacteria bacterium]|nr:AI-2E family transporter [Actinomycetota bacterium]
MDKDPWLKVLIVLLVVIAASYLAGLVWTLAVRFADILLLLALAWVLAFALEPVTYALEAHSRVGRGLAVSTVYLGLLIILSLATLLLVPVVALQVSQIGTNLPLYTANVTGWVASFQQWLGERGIEMNAATVLDYREMARRAEALGPVIVNNALALAAGVASVLFSIVLVLILSFYVMMDGSRFTAALLKAIPPDRRDELNYLFYSTHRAFGGFIRGQLVQAIIYGAGTAAIMLLADLPYTAVAAMFAFAVMMIPFIGPMLGIVPPLAISLFIHPERLWWVFLLLLLLQQVVLNVLAPKVMGQTVGMHPLLVLVSLLVGAKLAGVWGAIFAVPVAGVIVAMISFYRMTVEERKRHLEGKSEEPAWQAVTNAQAHGGLDHGTSIMDS